MSNLSAFLGFFFSYLILFAVFVVIAIVGCVIGINLRKSKDAKEGSSQAPQASQG